MEKNPCNSAVLHMNLNLNEPFSASEVVGLLRQLCFNTSTTPLTISSSVQTAVPPAPATFTTAPDDGDDEPSNLVDMIAAGQLPPTASAPQAAGPVLATTPELDSAGLPWDARVHSDTKSKTKVGEWRKKKGVDDTVYSVVVAELRQVYPNPFVLAAAGPVLATIPAPPSPPAAAPLAPSAPALALVPPPPVPSVPPPAPSSISASEKFIHLLNKMAPLRSISIENADALDKKGVEFLTHHGLKTVLELQTRADLIDSYAAYLGVQL